LQKLNKSFGAKNIRNSFTLLQKQIDATPLFIMNAVSYPNMNSSFNNSVFIWYIWLDLGKQFLVVFIGMLFDLNGTLALPNPPNKFETKRSWFLQ